MKSPKKDGDLPPVLKKTLGLLRVNPTTNYIIKKTGKDKRNVSKDINRLIKKGYIKRIERGLYKVLKSPILEQVVAVSREKSDYFRYHNLQIEVRLRKDEVAKVRNKILKNMHYRNNPNGLYIKYLLTGLVSNDSLYLYFPEKWDVVADTIDKLMDRVYEEIMDILYKWANKFKVGIFKDGKVNFNIRNQHIALCKNGVVKEFKGNRVKELVIKDSDDGKARFLMDFSNNVAELEAVHPTKATDDVQEAKYFMNTLKEGRYRRLYEAGVDFFDNGEKTQSELEKEIAELREINLNMARVNQTMAERQNDIQQQLMALVEIVKRKI